MRRWVFVILVVACGPPSKGNGNGDTVDGGVDATPPCTEGTTDCVGAVFQRCQGGQFVTVETCSRYCSSQMGCVDCFPETGRTCVDNDVHECTPEGQVGAMVETCSGGLQCDSGVCSDLCGSAAEDRSYIGCDYYAVDLWNVEWIQPVPPVLGICGGDQGSLAHLNVCFSAGGPFGGTIAGLCDNNTDCTRAPAGSSCMEKDVCLLDGQHAPYAVVVANPSVTSKADVTIATQTGESATVEVPPRSIQPLFPQMLGLPDQSLAWSSIEQKGYRVTSSRPIVAYQFNPLDNVGVFSNDGSLLLPTSTYDTRYYVVTQPSSLNRPADYDWNGYATIVAQAATTIAVTPSAPVQVGTGTVPAIPAGATQMFTLQAGDVLTLAAEGGHDLTGTLIESLDSVPFGAFAGHVCTSIGTGSDLCCCDHLEDQLFPTSTWGKKYAVARSLTRGTEGDKLRIVAQAEDTSVSFNPPIADCPTMLAGEWCEVDVAEDVEITANHPVLVAQFLYSVGGGTTNNPQGDPALAFMVPVEQYRLAYDLLVPSQYRTNFFAIVAPASGPVILDGANIEGQLHPFGSNSFRAGRVMVDAGPHRLECGGCGVTVGGYDSAVSYLFAGGLNLEQIVIPD